LPDPAKNPASSTSSDPREQGAWAQIEGTWHPLHGSFPEQGLSVEWHDFRVEHDLDWGRSFHPGSLEICLNFSGAGTLQDGEVQRAIGPNQVAIYTLQNWRLKARRSANSLHRFLTIELSPGFLRTHFGAELEKLKLPIRHFVEQGAKAPPYLEIRAMPASLLASRVQFVEPPVPELARRTWYLGRVLEILAQTVFLEENPDELFCHKHQRTNRERVERVRYLVERDLTNPPSLEMLADEVGCSTFYLSRIFAQESGASIPKFLRMKRIEKAAELLRTGKANVTEAAFTVGYSSLSAFNKAFVEQMGCCPGLYPKVPIAGRKARPSARSA
jgi:AraC-like DNA-binding protein